MSGNPNAAAGRAPWVLGISASHNGAACLLRGSDIVVAMQEERLSGVKRDRVYGARPSLAVGYCLDHAGIEAGDLDLVVLCVQGEASSAEQDPTLNPQLRLAANGVPWLRISHHLGHAVSAYATSGFTDAAILVVDGVGSPWLDLSPAERSTVVGEPQGWETVSVYHARGASVLPVEKQLVRDGLWLDRHGTGMPRFGSIGGMYSAVAAQIFGDPMDAGKVMGLAPYGRPTFPPAAMATVEDSVVRFDDAVPRAFAHDDRWPHRRDEYADLAASAQGALEAVLREIVGGIRKRGLSTRLCYAGGVALNCVLNERLWTDFGFDDVYIPPFAEDSGPAVGAAFHGLWHLTGGGRPVTLHTDGLGRRYPTDETVAAIGRVPGVRTVCADPDDTLERAAARLAAGEVCGFFDGRAELGPRALGHRSILADPRSPTVKERLNARIKQREGFRPFAPAVLEDHVTRWFEVAADRSHSPFMLRSWPLRAGREELVPAVAHVDGSARVQTVLRHAEPVLYGLLERFHARTGVPMVLNTSFNGSGQPIVETPLDAVWSILELGLDFLVLDGRLVEPDPTGPRSLLDLTPTMAAVGYTLDLPLPGAAMSLTPDASSTFDFRVGTPWGERRHRVSVDTVAVLALVDGQSTGRAILARLASSPDAVVDEVGLCRSLRMLRRSGVIDFGAPEPDHTA